jgi:hypothetical protein
MVLAMVTGAVSYQVLTAVLTAVTVAGLAYSLGALAKESSASDKLNADWFLEQPHFAGTPLHDDFREFKRLLLETFTRVEASTWLTSPHPMLAGASPIDVLFSQGLDAVKPALLASHTDGPTVSQVQDRWATVSKRCGDSSPAASATCPSEAASGAAWSSREQGTQREPVLP